MADTPKSASDPETKTILLLFIGRRKNPKKKLYWLWYKIDPDQNDGSALKWNSDRESFFEGKLLVRGVRPGMVVSIKADATEKSVFPSSGKVEGAWRNADDVARWNALQRAAEAEIEAEGAAVKKVKAALPFEALAPFRRAYRAASNTRQQAHILAMVIHAIAAYE